MMIEEITIFVGFAVILSVIYWFEKQEAKRGRQLRPPVLKPKDVVHEAHKKAAREMKRHGPFRTAADAINRLIRRGS